MKTAGLRAKDVVRQLLSFSTKSDQKQKPVKISPIIKDCLKFLRSSIPTSIEIRKSIPDESGIISGDPTQIHQMMMNLCTNAAQAMSESGGIMEVGLSLIEIGKHESTQDIELNQGQYVKITVSDTGHGISKENIDRIFNPYFTTKEVGEGSGIGLSVVHGIVKNHNGSVSVDSEYGKGTTFNVLFPVIEKEPASEEKTDTTIPTGNERILFVDDERSIAKMASQMLERLGYTVTTKTSSKDTLETFRSQPDNFDLIISDMSMPNIMGDKLANELQQIRPDIPIILCTGYSERINDEKVKSIGVRTLVMKPIVKSELAKTIRKVLDTKSGERRKYKRFKVKKVAVAILKSNPSRPSQIIDICKGGLAYRHAISRARSIKLNKPDELTIYLPEKGYYFNNITCKTISDFTLADDAPLGAIAMKRRSIQFDKLAPNQTDQLDFFIENHTISP